MNIEQKLRTFNISYKQFKDAIPKHCFERDLKRGLQYLAIDVAHTLFWLALQVYLVPFAWSLLSSSPLLQWTLVPILSLAIIWMQGVSQVSLWVLAHECGHGAFSDDQNINDLVGYTVHTMLMVPYFGWQRSHAKHHHYTGNVIHDEVWIPRNLERSVEASSDDTHMFQFLSDRGMGYPRSRIVSAWKLFVDCSIGFIPKLFTLVLKATSRVLISQAQLDKELAEAKAKDEAAAAAAVKAAAVAAAAAAKSSSAPGEPAAADLAPEEKATKDRKFASVPAWKSALDGVGMALWISFIFHLWYQCGLSGIDIMIRAWLLPLVVTLFFLSMITFLHHTHEEVPFFDDGEWQWFKAAIFNTIDRSLGPYLDEKLHFITTTHIVHHVFPRLPFYHAEEATTAARKVLGEYYNHSTSTSFAGWCADIWTNYRYCLAMIRRRNSEGFWWWKPSSEQKNKAAQVSEPKQ